MKLQTEQDEEPDINLTSLIDVVFLLLIFFMVSATFERQALLRVELPESSQREEPLEVERVELVITESGEYFVGEQLLVDDRRATLEQVLAERFEARPDAVLVIRADGAAPHRLVVRAMDAAARQGIDRLSVATVQEDGEAQ
ncbi:MAG: biopolymer transporter ExbD [Wenzhouxiangellaceae bacterium]|nr:biopolymer transporter ExbD [Wenzhouxiangellaceae bacterium]